MALLNKKETSPTKNYQINVNKHAFTKEGWRIFQLTAFFHYLKIALNGVAFTEIEAENARYYIPFSFGINETMAIVQQHGMKMLYIEIDENNYIEITFDTINIQGSERLYNTCKKLLLLAEEYQVVPHTFYFDLSTNAEWLWQRYLNNQFNNCMEIGEELFGNGYIMVHPLDEDEAEVVYYQEFDKYKGKIEYVVIRSNIQDDKILVIDNVTREAFGCGFDELEEIELGELLRNEG